MRNYRLALALLALRVSVFIVMFMWTIDKFIRPEHAAAIYEKFYYITDLSNYVSYTIGIIEILFLIGFLFGKYKRFTYGFVLLIHGISTFSSFKQYLAPFEGVNLLFFAAWPMLAACFALYILREQDTLCAIKNDAK